MEKLWLIDFWGCAIAFAILMYVVLHRYDLGLSIFVLDLSRQAGKRAHGIRAQENQSE
jgi:hypothetical protein